MKRKTTKILIVVTLISFISTLFLATLINHFFNYIPYYQDFEEVPNDWTLSNCSLTEEVKTSGTRSLNLTKSIDSNLSYAIFDYNHILFEKEINFWFYFESIESYTPVDIIFIHDPSFFTTNKDFKLWLNNTHNVTASYNYTLTSFSTVYSSIELMNNTWNYFSIKFGSNNILVYLNESKILEINNYSIGAVTFEFPDIQDIQDLQDFTIGGGNTGFIYLGKNFQYPFESISYKLYFDGFEIKEITFPAIPGFPLISVIIITIFSTIIILIKRYRILNEKIKSKGF